MAARQAERAFGFAQRFLTVVQAEIHRLTAVLFRIGMAIMNGIDRLNDLGRNRRVNCAEIARKLLCRAGRHQYRGHEWLCRGEGEGEVGWLQPMFPGKGGIGSDGLLPAG